MWIQRLWFALMGGAALLVLSACGSVEAPEQQLQLSTQAIGDYDYTLIAGQNMEVGGVDVVRSGNTLQISISVETDWCLTESHVHVAADPDDIPQTNGGLVPGGFDYFGEHACIQGPVTYDVDLANVLSGGLDGVTDVVIAVHAVVEGMGDNEGIEETAWAGGTKDDWRNWSMYIPYDLSRCVETITLDDGSTVEELILVELASGEWPDPSDETAYLIWRSDGEFSLQLDTVSDDARDGDSYGYLKAQIDFCRAIESVDPGVSPNGLENGNNGTLDVADWTDSTLDVVFQVTTAPDRIDIDLE